MRNIFFYLFTLIFLCSCQTSVVKVAEPSLSGKIKIIGHRGAAGYRPEHTLESYQTAIDMKADFIEPDLVLTKDGILIARHENEISETTDVAKKFPDRRATKFIDGQEVSGWFTEDFTLAEIKGLLAVERLASRDHTRDGKYEIPTFEEILLLVQHQEKILGRKIGIYPETKHPTYFRNLGMSMEDSVFTILKKYQMEKSSDRIYLQSFEIGSLVELKKLMPELPCVFLLGEANEAPYDLQVRGEHKTYAYFATDSGLREVAKFANAIGPKKAYLISDEGSRIVSTAHQLGLEVHPYTFMNDLPFLPIKYFNHPEQEYYDFFAMGVDAVFSDFADTAVRSRETFEQQKINPK